MSDPSEDDSKKENRLDRFAKLADLVQKILGSLAILAGAYWFFVQSKFAAIPEIDYHLDLARIDDSTWGSLGLKIKNQGNTKIKIPDAEFFVEEINHEFATSEKAIASVEKSGRVDWDNIWPDGGSDKKVDLGLTIMPGETETAHFEFVIDESVEIIQCVVSFPVPGSRKKRWNEYIIFRIDEHLIQPAE